MKEGKEDLIPTRGQAHLHKRSLINAQKDEKCPDQLDSKGHQHYPDEGIKNLAHILFSQKSRSDTGYSRKRCPEKIAKESRKGHHPQSSQLDQKHQYKLPRRT